MTAIKAAKTAPRERTSSQNGLPEPVPYVYRQQKRSNTYAARITRRNAEGSAQPPALAVSAGETLGVAVRPWLRAKILAVSTLPELNTASKAPADPRA